MKKITLGMLLILSISALAACSSGEVNTSSEMKDFMSKLNGKASGVEEAVDTYVSPKLFGYDITKYNLENPTITKQKDECYTMEAQYSDMTRVYEICWENQQITKLEFLEEKASKK